MSLFIVLDIPARNWLPWFLTLVQICGITELLRDPSFLQNVGSMSRFRFNVAGLPPPLRQSSSDESLEELENRTKESLSCSLELELHASATI